MQTTVQVKFHGISTGGDGVGRDGEGRTVFAPFAAPQDIAQVEIEDAKKNFARGQIIQLEAASPQRIVPPCPYYLPQNGAPSCGGCQIQHLNYQAQLDAKTQLVRDALQRVGGFDEPPVENCLASPQQFGYRNKMRFFIGANGEIGLHARRTHQVVDIERCPLAQEPINDVLQQMRDLLRNGRHNQVQNFRVRVDSQHKIALEITWDEATSEDKKAVFAALRARNSNLIDPNRQKLEETVGETKFQLSAFDFFQVNSSLTPLLVQTALEMAHIENGQRALDLFCGAGLFGVFMAKAGARVEGVDVKEHLNQNAHLNGLSARGFRDNAARFLRRAAQEKHAAKRRYDVVLLDPPREGAAECIAPLVQLQVPRLVYVSCDPATLARDAKTMAKQGYILRRAVPLDMFPQTAHVETVALLELSGS